MSDFRTPLKSARGLGSAKEGTHHWIGQRATAVALIPLVIWFGAFVVANLGASYAQMTAALSQPHVAVLMVLFLLAAFHHMRLGLQVVVEDYIAKQGSRLMFLMIINALTFVVGFAAVFSVLKISLMPAAVG